VGGVNAEIEGENVNAEIEGENVIEEGNDRARDASSA
jgi:hypothetical protein